MDCVSAARGRQGHALEAQGTWFVPVPHPGSPLHCTRLSQPLFLTAGLPPLCPGSPASAVSLIRASQPLQQGVGTPSPGMAPDKQLEPLDVESVISIGNAENKPPEPGGERLIISHIATVGPSTLSFCLCIWNLLLVLQDPVQQCLLSTKPPLIVTQPPTPCKLPLPTAQNPFLPFIVLRENFSRVGVPTSLGAPESRHSVSAAQHKA